MDAGCGLGEKTAAVGGPGARGVLLFPILASLAFLGVAIRLAQLQILEHERSSAEVAREIYGVVRERDRRGAIVDARGRLLASSVAANACALDPKSLLETEGANPGKVLERLAKILDLKPADRLRLTESLEKRRIIKTDGGESEEPYRFIWVKRRLSDGEWESLSAEMAAARREAAEARRNRQRWLRKAGEAGVARRPEARTLAREAAEGWRRVAREAEGRFAGVFFPPDYRRVYPQGELAAHLLGFADIDGRGLEGAEKAFQPFLEGMSLDRLVARDARSRALSPLAIDNRPSEGMTVELTLDSVIQAIVEEELTKGVEALKRDSPEVTAHAVILDPATGAILAMANHPTFDPNRPGEFPARNRRNDAVASVQEPGSTLKPLILSASIEEKLANFDETVDCGTFRMDNGRTIKDIHPYGRMTLRLALVKSSNPAMVRIGLRLGPERMRQYAVRYGFGEKTGSLLPGEVGGRLTSAANWSSYTMGSVPMGYEINVTTLQMAAAYSAIANGGVLYRPYLVKSFRSPGSGPSLRTEPLARRRVISADTAALMRSVLRQVVTEGTGRRANLAEYELGGKTGTANMIANDRERAAGVRGYSKTRHTANFVALAPWNEPRAVICVSVRDTGKYGGEASSPVGAAIARRVLAYLGAPARGGAGEPHSLAGGVIPPPPAPPAAYTVGDPDDDNALEEEVDPRLWEEWLEDEDAAG